MNNSHIITMWYHLFIYFVFRLNLKKTHLLVRTCTHLVVTGMNFWCYIIDCLYAVATSEFESEEAMITVLKHEYDKALKSVLDLSGPHLPQDICGYIVQTAQSIMSVLFHHTQCTDGELWPMLTSHKDIAWLLALHIFFFCISDQLWCTWNLTCGVLNILYAKNMD